MVDQNKPLKVAPAYRVDGDGKLHLDSISIVPESFAVDPHTEMVWIEEASEFTREQYEKILDKIPKHERDNLMYGTFHHGLDKDHQKRD